MEVVHAKEVGLDWTGLSNHDHTTGLPMPARPSLPKTPRSLNVSPPQTIPRSFEEGLAFPFSCVLVLVCLAQCLPSTHRFKSQSLVHLHAISGASPSSALFPFYQRHLGHQSVSPAYLRHPSFNWLLTT